MEQIQYSVNLDIPYVGAAKNDTKAHFAHHTGNFENYLHDTRHSVAAP